MQHHDSNELAVVVDADLVALRAVRRVLEDLDFRVVTLSAPSAALAMTRARRVDVVVFDVTTARGLDFAAEILACSPHERPALLALVQPSSASAPDARAADVVLEKPVRVASLVDGVESALALARARRVSLERSPLIG